MRHQYKSSTRTTTFKKSGIAIPKGVAKALCSETPCRLGIERLASGTYTLMPKTLGEATMYRVGKVFRLRVPKNKSPFMEGEHVEVVLKDSMVIIKELAAPNEDIAKARLVPEKSIFEVYIPFKIAKELGINRLGKVLFKVSVDLDKRLIKLKLIDEKGT